MTQPDTPTTAQPHPKPQSRLRRAFSQANITTGLAVFAVVLAAAPYVAPPVRTWMVRDGLMAQPVILQDASDALNNQRQAAASKALAEGVKTHHDSLFNDASDPVLGDPKAPIKIVEFLDYNCGYCRAATPVLKDYLAKNPDVAIIVKEYPVINQNSRPLASFALAAAQEGKYAEAHYALMTSKIDSEAAMNALLQKLGLDPVKTRQLAMSKPIQDHIDKVMTLGADLNVSGTPTFVVGDQAIDGAKMDELKAAVEAQRKTFKKR
ncbi:DsbA family protein [Asticcacaulis sp. EMRT-3]|uniref:DsbA family protein n=1 Tax=Asticcacaulis sp. EMRT-3 TaxID=3040349 RepID=UPI0024AF373E|nr:DsbA family protein [Asticcacaulis sp. EMRT-3]MDI7774834.1 DsbA family protein [Asticcacaulis sp. EMRT-3]